MTPLGKEGVPQGCACRVWTWKLLYVEQHSSCLCRRPWAATLIFRRSALLSSGVHNVDKRRDPPPLGQQEGGLASATPALARSQQLDLHGWRAGGGSCRAAPTLLCRVLCRGFVQRKSPLSLAWSLLQHQHRRHRGLSWFGQLTQVPGETFVLAAAGESHRMFWIGSDLLISLSPTPLLGWGIFYQIMLLKAPSNLNLNTSRDGAFIQCLSTPMVKILSQAFLL